MIDTEALFDEIVGAGKVEAAVRVAHLVAWAAPELPHGSIAELMEDGRVDAWDMPGGPAVVLTPRSAARLGLKLLPDSSRWVAARAPERPRKRPRDARRRAILEVDLEDADETPLDQHADPRSREAVDEDLMRERIDQIRRTLRTHHLRKTLDIERPPEVVLMGSHPYPHPGQDRGPWAPIAVPSEFEVARGRARLVRYEGPTPGLCHACKKSVLPERSACEPCMRLSDEGRYLEGQLDAARARVAAAWAALNAEAHAEVLEAWAAWGRRRAEVEAENLAAIREIAAGPDHDPAVDGPWAPRPETLRREANRP